MKTNLRAYPLPSSFIPFVRQPTNVDLPESTLPMTAKRISFKYGGTSSSWKSWSQPSVSDSKIKKTISIYSVWYNPFWERDVQWIFIKKTELLDNDTIRIYNENGEVFDLKLTKYKVKKIK